jgi:hypothetical protein
MSQKSLKNLEVAEEFVWSYGGSAR